MRAGPAFLFLQNREDVDDGRAVIDHGMTFEDPARIATRQRQKYSIDICRERLHLLLPARRQLSPTRDLLLQSRRQVAVLGRVVRANDLDFAR